MMLTSRFEMWLGWGDDLCFFYNDAYIPTLGAKHPWALGEPFREVWKEVYADVEDQVRSVMVEGVATWNKALQLLLERNGYPEETYHTFSYSPLRDGEAIRGLMCIVTEETERVISERRLDTVRRLGECLIGTMSQEAVLQGVCDALAANTEDFPFALAYVHDALGGLVGCSATDEGRGLLRMTWPLAGGSDGSQDFPLDEEVDYPTGGWAIPPRRALILPIPAAHGGASATLVLGLNPHRKGDDGLNDLANLVADRSAGAFAQAHSVETERRRSDRIWTNSRDLMVVVDGEGVFQSVSPAWTRILGHPVEAVVGRRVETFVLKEDLEVTRLALSGVLTGEQVTGFENRYETADGGHRWISWNTAFEDGLVYGYGRDVTEEKLQALQLKQAEDALRQAQKMEAIGQLTGGVAHDFNNLLTVIRSSADLLRTRELGPERRRRYVDAISDTADRAAKLTSQLLSFSRRQALKPECFNVVSKVEALGDILRSVLGARVHLDIDVACHDCAVEADANQFETALINLAVNARDAMDGEGALTIRIDAATVIPAIRGHAQGSGDFVTVAVIDQGAGIAAADLAKIFEPFFTTKEIGRGTGLGLSQVYGFAKQSGGDVAVASAPGEGAAFTLYLPRTHASALAPEPPMAFSRMRHHGRILVVEDNAAIGEFATQLLRDLGYQTELATNAADALARLDRDGPFDLLFSDVVMPGVGGVELARTVRKRWPDLPVVLTSGYSHVLATDARHGFPLLHKPYSVEDLSHILRQTSAVA
ncbi:hybrid sensor histidine kinase/response regulator [Caulobacter endophyticus]|uniref:hybrid sensor histidine kinase/response regulator n=1 Tax=Caulobacter endophyticus TaxID=2172652 RepID=UPI002410A64D|nr:ATP-binding protein [Caulobacter endophyticus]MDG2528988.1 ATP-binding protein [Caulobacter endophyticus]